MNYSIYGFTGATLARIQEKERNKQEQASNRSTYNHTSKNEAEPTTILQRDMVSEQSLSSFAVNEDNISFASLKKFRVPLVQDLAALFYGFKYGSPMGDFIIFLQTYFTKVTGRELVQQEIQYLKNKLLDGKKGSTKLTGKQICDFWDIWLMPYLQVIVEFQRIGIWQYGFQLPDSTSAPYFYPFISRFEAEQLLINCRPGFFLLRMSESKPLHIVLSTRVSGEKYFIHELYKMCFTARFCTFREIVYGNSNREKIVIPKRLSDILRNNYLQVMYPFIPVKLVISSIKTKEDTCP